MGEETITEQHSKKYFNALTGIQTRIHNVGRNSDHGTVGINFYEYAISFKLFLQTDGTSSWRDEGSINFYKGERQSCPWAFFK
jgi:hypothetical protein